MLTLLSPAKKLLQNLIPYTNETTEPGFINETHQLVDIMKGKTTEQIAALMDLSNDLAKLNYERYQHFNFESNPLQSHPSLYLFQGDVYQGLAAKSWSEATVAFSQQHLGILSGLYGLLKPLDRIQPYRLEMGVRLSNPSGNTLYAFWKEIITRAINEELSLHKNPLLINLASTEYFKVIDEKKCAYPIVTINFYERKNNEIKMIGLFAKRARGMMAKYIMEQQIDNLEQITAFKESGYQFNKETSSERHIDFIRVHS